MERLRRINSFWNWLPAFRAVAEFQHLPTASRALFVTAPALSRAIHLLEKDLGVPLFRRTGRRLELNESGRSFLDAVRDAMRLMHEATLHVRAEQLSGPVRIASAGAITTTLLVPALEELRRAHSDLVPLVTTPPPDDLPGLLHRGRVDIAFHGPAAGLDGFETVDLGVATNSVYCGPGHALHGRKRITPERLTRHPFVAPPLDASGRNLDGWPIEVARTIAMQVDQLRVGLEICLRGGLLAVLPDGLVAEHGLAAALWRLPFPGIADDPMFATHRKTLGFTTRAEVVLASVRAILRHRAGRAPRRQPAPAVRKRRPRPAARPR